MPDRRDLENHQKFDFRKSLLADSEAVIQKCSVKKVFLKISQYLQENTCVRASFLIKLQASGTGVFLWILEIFQNTFFYRTPPVAASADFYKEIANITSKC